MGAEAALVKGGHMAGDEVLDVLVTEDGVETASHPRIETDAIHGSGCMLSSAIAARLAHDEPLVDAVGRSVALMERAVRYHHDVGEGASAVHHLVDVRNEAARHETAEAVENIVDWFAERDVSPLVPEVGMNVVGALPYAEEPAEMAAVEGRITRTLSGVKPNRGVRFGASSHVARFLLTAREYHPDLRYAVNVRFDERVEAALDALEGEVAAYDRESQPDDIAEREGSTMQWAASRVFDGEEYPVAVIDRGDHGKEPITKVVGETPQRTAERVVLILDALPP
jgi:hydroxymethylpyrimidine/phosphomethylpyrimidine kinase